MQREREGRNNLFDMGDPLGGFPGFGSFGFRRNMMMPSLFGGRDPFDDPFFTRPFGSIFETSSFGRSASCSSTPETIEAKGVSIEELNSDDEGEKEEDNGFGKENDNSKIRSGSGKEPSVEHPDDDVDANEGISKKVNYKNQHNKWEGTKPQSHNFSFQSCKVTYGGVDGAYYTSTRTRRAGSDGAVLEESKEADRTTGQATHRISRGIHDKGHSVTRKLNSDGKVDTSQTLHNLNEDELAGFEEGWKGNVKKHMPSWRDEFDTHGNAGSGAGEQKGKATWRGRLLPSSEQAWNFGGTVSDDRPRTSASEGKTKKVVRINVE